jgi:hypothetical protein
MIGAAVDEPLAEVREAIAHRVVLGGTGRRGLHDAAGERGGSHEQERQDWGSHHCEETRMFRAG